MNVFNNPEIAGKYDNYYQTDFGKKVDEIEKNLVLSLISDIPRGVMLEVGCGTGHWTRFFIDQGFKLTGIDISESMLQIVKKKKD